MRAWIVVAGMALASVASAQSVQNPSLVSFVCEDHAVDDGHELGFFLAGAPEPVQSVQLGDPPADATGRVVAVIDSRPLALGAYTAKVRAASGALVSEWSDPSNPFERILRRPTGLQVQ